MDKEHKDPERVDLKAPRFAWYLHTAWKKVDISIVEKKGFKFYQTRSNAIILYNTLPAYCISKAIKMEIGEIKNEKENAPPRLPSKISLRNDWMKELGSKVAGQSEGSQPTQPNPNPIHRTGRPVVTEQTSRSSAQEIDTRFSLDCENTNLFVEHLERQRHRRRRRPVGGHWPSQLEEIEIDFRCLHCHMQLWNKQKTSVFVSS